jgi:hypothetical protein
MNKKIKYGVIAIVYSILLFLLFGIPTALIPTPWFSRMVGKTFLDYLFLIFSSILLGAYIGVHYYKKNTMKKCNVVTTSGGVAGFLSFSCPVCNKILIILFGTTALMTYLEPYRPAIGFSSISILGLALYWRLKV